MNTFLKLYEILISWLRSKLTPRQTLVFSSVIVGFTAGLFAVLLKLAVFYIHHFITHDYNIDYPYLMYMVFPTIGIFLSVIFVQYHLKGRFRKGTANVLHAIAKKSSFLKKDQMYSHLVTSALTVGFGGSAGLEAPIVVTGAAIGSNFGKTHKINYNDRTLLVGCGAAAGIAAAFNSPIAGVLFALEVLLADVTISAFIPLIIAAATGGLLSKIILQESTLLTFKSISPFDYHNVPYYLILGLLAGLISVYYARVYLKIDTLWTRGKFNVYTKVLLGGSMLAILILFFPSLFGEGYESIKILSGDNPEKLFENSILSNFLSNNCLIILFILLTMFFKTIAAAITIGSGGNGGNFAPSLFVGAYLGFAFAKTINFLEITSLSISNFTIVSMAGVLSGVMHAPLTAIFLIAEITGGYELMIPLMIVSSSSYIISKYFEPFSMDLKRLAIKGEIFTADKDRNILTSLKTSNLTETDFQIVSPDETLGTLIKTVANSKRNIFPVVSNEKLVGVVVIDNIREIMFKHEMYDTVFVKEIMREPFAIITPEENMDSVMKKFDETGAWNLPVLKDGKYIGFISKTSIFIHYRNRLTKRISE